MRSFIKTFLFLGLMLPLVSCYEPNTHGKFITDKSDVWINGYAVRLDEHEEADKGLVFCRASIQEDGSAKPKCFKAQFTDSE